MAVMSPSPASRGKPTYILSNQLRHPGTQHKGELISELANNENTLTITLTEMHSNDKILDSEIQMKNYIGFRADRTLC